MAGIRRGGDPDEQYGGVLHLGGGRGFADIGQGAFGLWFKFVGENVPFIVLPPLVLYAIHLQIDQLTRWAGRHDPDA